MSGTARQEGPITYHLAGDSTVAACPVFEYPMSGWGPYLHHHVSGPVKNHARGGHTTQSFIDDGYWAELLAGVCPSDVVLIQFGHNDQKRRRPDLEARHGFRDRLEGMIEDVRSLNAAPILCTPVERRTFLEGKLVPSHGDYPNAVRDLAVERDVQLFDLTAFTSWLYEDLGPDGSAALFCHFLPGEHPHWTDGLHDDTHLHERGARKVAAFIGRSLRAFERADGDCEPLGSDARH